MFTDVYVSYSEGGFSITYQSKEKQMLKVVFILFTEVLSFVTLYMIMETDHTKTFAIKCQTYTIKIGKTNIKIIQSCKKYTSDHKIWETGH